MLLFWLFADILSVLLDIVLARRPLIVSCNPGFLHIPAPFDIWSESWFGLLWFSIVFSGFWQKYRWWCAGVFILLLRASSANAYPVFHGSASCQHQIVNTDYKYKFCVFISQIQIKRCQHEGNTIGKMDVSHQDEVVGVWVHCWRQEPHISYFAKNKTFPLTKLRQL